MLPNEMSILRNTRAELQEQLDAIHHDAGDQPLSRSAQGKWDRLMAEVRKIDAEIEEAQISVDRAENTKQSRAKWDTLHIGGSGREWDEFDVRSESPAGLVARAHTVLERSEDLTDQARESLAIAIDRPEGSTAAALTLARSNPHYESGFLKVLRSPERAFTSMTPQELAAFGAVEAVRASMSTDAGTAGYTIPLSLDPSLAAIANDGTSNPFRAHATIRQAISSPHRLTTSAGATAAWTDEGAAFGDGSPAFDRVDVELFKQTIYVTGTYEILEDGGRTIREALPVLLADARDRIESAAYAVGSGSGSPFGVITTLAATTGSTVTATTRGSFTSASHADVMGMLAALPPRARKSGSAAWLAPVEIINIIRTQTIGTSGSMITDMAAAGIPQLLGLPVYESSDMAATTTSGSRPLAVVDLAAYSIVDHIAGPTLQYVPVVFDSTTGRPNGTAAWVYHHRTGAQLTDPNQGRLLLC